MRTLGALRPGDHRLLVEAAIWIVLARLLILLMPFSRIARHLGLKQVEVSAPLDAVETPELTRIEWALRAIASRMPWVSCSRAQAIAGSLLLRRRGIPSTIYLNVAKGRRDAESLPARAWLRCGDTILVGEASTDRLASISAFLMMTAESAESPSASERLSPLAAASLALLLQAELNRIMGTLESSSIPAVVLKGMPLSIRAFGSISSRTFSDNDLLVRRADVERAYGVLTSLGYAACSVHQQGFALDGANQIRCIRRTRLGSAAVELHWSPFEPRLYPVREELIWEHVEPFEYDQLRCLVFVPTLTLVHLASHYASHKFQWTKILWDVAAAWNTWHERIDRVELMKLARATHQVPALAIALRKAQEAQLLESDAPIIPSPRADIVLKLLKGRFGATALGRILLSLALARPDRSVRMLARYLFPPSRDLPLIYGSESQEGLRRRRLTRPLELALGFAVGSLISRASRPPVSPP